MPVGSPENIPLGECTLSRSRDQLTPLGSRTNSTVFSLSRSESLWTNNGGGGGGGGPGGGSDGSLSGRGDGGVCDVYWFPIHLMSTGGSFLACGLIISGLYFAGHCRKVTNILGPALLSIGLMVFVVGLVLVPITKENRKQQPILKNKHLMGYYRPPPASFSV